MEMFFALLGIPILIYTYIYIYYSTTVPKQKDFYCSPIDAPEGYYYHEMVGMKYHVSDDDLGVKEAYALAEENNQYDPYAISIHRDFTNKTVGYIPRGNEELHRNIKYRGGKAKAIYRIQRINQKYYAQVYIKVEYKVFRLGSVRQPYLSRTAKTFRISTIKGFSGRLRCWLTTDNADYMDYNYSVNVIDENHNIIGYTDDNQLQLFDYVQMHGDMVPAACSVKHKELFVPLNYTEKTIEKKIKEYIGENKQLINN